jgi:phosphatidate cytidylyltransferase
MSWQRFLPPALFFPFLAYVVFGREPVFFTILVGVVVVLGLLEFYNMVQKEDWWFMGLFFGIIIVGQAHQNEFSKIAGGIVYILISAFLILGLIRPFLIAHISRFSIIAIIFGIGYVAFFISHLILIRNMEEGRQLLLYLFCVVWASDGGAYLIGRRFGRHKGIFKVSPNKSIEGLLGGLAGSLAFSLFLGGSIGLNGLESFVMGLLLSLVALLGDLIESSFKRNVGAKDSGNWIMEYGGILDVFDSIILSAPFFYYLYLFRLGA